QPPVLLPITGVKICSAGKGVVTDDARIELIPQMSLIRGSDMREVKIIIHSDRNRTARTIENVEFSLYSCGSDIGPSERALLKANKNTMGVCHQF
ncbi:hypothetical protein PENTCL1PPCAC_18062, partial [Pristionchus entomophagus]